MGPEDSGPAMSPSRRNTGLVPTAIELVEESVHLLRGAPSGALAIYLAGTAPFVLGVLFFWAYVTWFTPPPAVIAWAACGLAALFAVMKTAHADFCTRLMAIRLRAPAPPLSAGRLMGIAAGQMRIQAWGLLVLPFAICLALPFGWVYAYYQNASVLCQEEDVNRLASEQAKVWPAQNHLGLLVLAALFLAALLNVGGAFFILPWLANKMLGIDNTFGIGGWGKVNTTFVASVFCLSWLAVDPIVKAFYVLRVFYGRARSTGEDLRVELQKARSMAGLRRMAALVVLGFAFCGSASSAPLAGAQPAPASVSPEKLEASIDEVMAGRDFQWRLRKPAAVEDTEADGPIKAFVRKGVDILRAMTSGISRLWKRMMRWLDGLFPDAEPAKKETSAPAAGGSALRVVLIIFAAAIVVFAGVVVYFVATRGRAERRKAIEASPVAPTRPDIADEASHAGQLRAEEWLDIAREQLALGEWRLAWRALYLATLARLAADGLVSLVKSKTNLDYEREVRRRALGRTDVTEMFSARRTAYEDVWYGQLSPDERRARAWLEEMEGTGSP